MAVTLQRPYVGGYFFRGVVNRFRPVYGISDAGLPLIYTVSPPLPAGLVMLSDSGAIVGTPTVSGSLANYTVTVDEVTAARYNFTDTIPAGTTVTGYNLRARAIAAGWNGVMSLNAVINIQTGAVVTSSSPTVPALEFGTIPNGSSIVINVRGVIRGCNAIVGSTTYGGTALRATYPCTVQLYTSSATLAQIHSGAQPYNGYIIGGSGINAPTFVNTLAQDGDGAAGAAVVGGLYILWANTSEINNIYGPVDDWGAYSTITLPNYWGHDRVFFMGPGTKAVQATSVSPNTTTWTSSLPADWYWDTNTAGTVQQSGKRLTLRLFHYNASSSVVSARLYGAVDDSLTGLKINGVTTTFGSSMGPGMAYTSSNFNLLPGLNVVEISVENATVAGWNVAGLNMELRDTSNNVLQWRNSWKIAA